MENQELAGSSSSKTTKIYYLQQKNFWLKKQKEVMIEQDPRRIPLTQQQLRCDSHHMEFSGKTPPPAKRVLPGWKQIKERPKGSSDL
jgi:hypothetical protein